MRIAGLDLGTNTFLCLIADVDPASKAIKVVRDEVRIVRLGQGVQATRELHPEALQRSEETFKEFKSFIDAAGCDVVQAVATSAARDVKNGSMLLELGRKYGIPIEIISGEKEAEMTFAGSIEAGWSRSSDDLTAVIDVGGGSTEIILGSRQGILLRFSADVGSVRLTEKYISGHPIVSKELDAIKKHVVDSIENGMAKSLTAFNHRDLPADGSLAPPDAPLTLDEIDKRLVQVVAVAGTPTTLAAVELGKPFEAEVIHDYIMEASKLDQWIVKLGLMSVEERQRLGGMEPKRADVIVAGAICLREAQRVLKRDRMKVSIRGLRFGVVQWCATR